MLDTVKAFRYVGIQNKFRTFPQTGENRFNGIVCASTGSKTVAVGFKLGFPFGFKGKFNEGLVSAVKDGGDTEWTLLRAVWLFNPNSSEGLGWTVCFEGFNPFHTLFGIEDGFAIDAGCPFAAIILCHTADCQAACCP